MNRIKDWPNISIDITDPCDFEAIAIYIKHAETISPHVNFAQGAKFIARAFQKLQNVSKSASFILKRSKWLWLHGRLLQGNNSNRDCFPKHILRDFDFAAVGQVQNNGLDRAEHARDPATAAVVLDLRASGKSAWQPIAVG